jgi:hypothetical protein
MKKILIGLSILVVAMMVLKVFSGTVTASTPNGGNKAPEGSQKGMEQTRMPLSSPQIQTTRERTSKI